MPEMQDSMKGGSSLSAYRKEPCMNRDSSDEELLLRIAKHKDREAFQYLFERYSKPTYKLARYLARNVPQAEDAVQEAMLAIWKKAGRFDPARGAARTWILRIVANKTLAALRDCRGDEACGGSEFDLAERESGTDSPISKAEDRELSLALREQMQELPISIRQIMVLYYACEMKQAEIAQVLAMPQTTVSHRIREGLEELRRGLSIAGFTATLPLLGDEGIGKAILNSYEPPGRLAERIIARLDKLESTSVRIAGADRHGAFQLIGMFVVLVVVASGWWSLRPSDPRGATPADASALSPHGTKDSAIPSMAPPPHTPLPRVWDFNGPEIATDLKIVNRGWRWIEAGSHDGSGCMETTEETVLVELDLPDLNLPVEFTLRMLPRPSPSYIYHATVGFERCERGAIFHDVGKPFVLNRDQWLKRRIFITKNYMESWSNGTRTNLMAYDKPAGRVILYLRGRMRIDDLTVREIAPNELPEVSEYLAALERIPVPQRVGTIMIPELRSEIPGRHVSIEFTNQVQTTGVRP